MRGIINIEHYTSCEEGILLKRKYLDWKLMLKDLLKSRQIGEKNFLSHLEGNYAVGLLKIGTSHKFYYSTTRVKSEAQYNSFKDLVEKIQIPSLTTKVQRQEMMINLYYRSNLFYNYVKVDRFRGVRTRAAGLRTNDSESIVLENITEHVFNNKLSEFKVYIYTHKEPCLNCEMIFQQFIERHPLCELTILYHLKNTPDLPSKYNWRFK